MKLGVRAKLFLISVAVVLVSILGVYMMLSRSLEELLVERTREELHMRLDLVERNVSSSALPLEPSEAWQDIAIDIAARAGGRLTLVRADGAVLADSSRDLEGVRAMENHSSRPEVVDALARGLGEAERRSATFHEDMIYAAVPVKRDGTTPFVARLAVPQREVAASVQSLQRVLGAATIVALLAAIVTASIAAHVASQGVRQLTSAARRMASGDLATRTRVTGTDEFAQLGGALDQMADNLSTTLRDLVGERDLLSGILSSMREGVLLVDHDGLVALVNPALREMLYMGPDTVGKPPKDVIDHAELQQMLKRARAAEDAVSGEIEVTGIRPRRLLVRAEALAEGPGGLLVVFFDVTNLRRLETLRRDFVANASHELRTPVTAIRSAAETLQCGAMSDREALPLFLGIIDRNSERLQRLVDDLLDLSRIESRELRLQMEPIAVRTALEHVRSLFDDRAKSTKIRLQVKVGDDVPRIEADTRALEQVLTNLLDNAFKYCPEGSEITLRAVTERAKVRVSVEDNGPGIAEKHLARLFERFYRVDAGRSRQLGGTGLGLSIVKHLVEAMEGTIGIESQLGKGSSFTMTLPVYIPLPAEPASSRPAPNVAEAIENARRESPAA